MPLVYKCRFNHSRDESGAVLLPCRDAPMSQRVPWEDGREEIFCRCEAPCFLKPQQTLLSHLFVLVLIMALGAATERPLAFMRLMKVGAGGNCSAPLCVLAWLCEFTGASWLRVAAERSVRSGYCVLQMTVHLAEGREEKKGLYYWLWSHEDRRQNDQRKGITQVCCICIISNYLVIVPPGFLELSGETLCLKFRSNK